MEYIMPRIKGATLVKNQIELPKDTTALVRDYTLETPRRRHVAIDMLVVDESLRHLAF